MCESTTLSITLAQQLVWLFQSFRQRTCRNRHNFCCAGNRLEWQQHCHPKQESQSREHFHRRYASIARTGRSRVTSAEDLEYVMCCGSMNLSSCKVQTRE